MKENTLTHSFQNHYSKQTKHPHQGFPYREIRMSNKLRGLLWEWSPWTPKSLNFSLLLDMTPTKRLSPFIPFLITNHILGKKVSLIAFIQILPKILPAACMFSYTIMTYLEKLDGTKSLNTKQCPAWLCSRIIYHVSPFVPKMFPPLMLLYYTHQVWTVPPSPEPLWKTQGMGKNSTQQPKIYPFPKPERSPFNRFTSSTIKSVIPSASNTNFHVITLCKLDF